MPTSTHSDFTYVPRRLVFEKNKQQNASNSSQVDIRYDEGLDESYVTQSKSVKVLNISELTEIPTERKRRTCLLAFFGILVCFAVIASILVPFMVVYSSNQNPTSTTTAITSTTTYVPTFCNATCYITSRAAISTYTAIWAFENNINDVLNIYNATPVNSPGYSTGYVGQALSLTGTQYATTSFINFAYSSFTVEAWIKPTVLSNGGPDYAIFGECDLSGASKDNCMHLLLRNFNPYNLYMGFWVDDLTSRTTLTSSNAGTWIHVAFVYDYSMKQQNIYRNGYNDAQANLTGTPAAYVGTSGLVNIGAHQTNVPFNGLIDHMFVSNRAKSACEILDDATLVVYFSFDSGSVLDNGPNYLNGTITGSVTTVSGHVNEAFLFGSSSAYFYVGGLVALGTVNQAFSFSLWIKPTSLTGGGTILHVSIGTNGYDNGGTPWCVPFVGLDSSNRIIAQVWNGINGVAVTGTTVTLNVWTHIVETYSSTNGVILYVNGTRIGTTGATSYSASGTSDYIHLGYYGTSGSPCATGSINPGPFNGAIDEFRVYSRELSLSDVCVLANQ